MTDLPISSLTTTDSTTNAKQSSDLNDQNLTVDQLKAIVNQPLPPADDVIVPSVTTQPAVDVQTNPQPPQLEQPLIEIDLKKNYKKQVPQSDQGSTTTSDFSTYTSSPFGIPRPVETNTIRQEQTNLQEAPVKQEAVKSPEILKPEQEPVAETPQQAAQQIANAAPAQIVDLRKPLDAPKIKKKDILPNASKLTLKANDTEQEFITHILGAHGS